MNKREIEEQAMMAFSSASDNDYISPYSSASEVKTYAYGILEFMPNLEVGKLTKEEFDYAVQILLYQLY